MSDDRRFSWTSLAAYALGLLLYGALQAAGEWLPHDGWGLVLRWAIGIAFLLGLLYGLGQLVVSSVREFRRGLAGERGRAS